MSANANAVFCQHHARHCNFRRSKKLGIGDHLVQWQRPQRCPQSMSAIDQNCQGYMTELNAKFPGNTPEPV